MKKDGLVGFDNIGFDEANQIVANVIREYTVKYKGVENKVAPLFGACMKRLMNESNATPEEALQVYFDAIQYTLKPKWEPDLGDDNYSGYLYNKMKLLFIDLKRKQIKEKGENIDQFGDNIALFECKQEAGEGDLFENEDNDGY